MLDRCVPWIAVVVHVTILCDVWLMLLILRFTDELCVGGISLKNIAGKRKQSLQCLE